MCTDMAADPDMEMFILSDHVAICAIPFKLTDGCVSHLRLFLHLFSCHSFLPVEMHMCSSHAVDQRNHEG